MIGANYKNMSERFEIPLVIKRGFEVGNTLGVNPVEKVQMEVEALRWMGGMVCDCGRVGENRVMVYGPTDDGVGKLDTVLFFCGPCMDLRNEGGGDL